MAIEAKPTWVLRDFHSPNLIWLPNRSDIAQVGMLDFQDAVMGPAAYDVASLLQDARVDVPELLEVALLSQYVKRRAQLDSHFEPAEFLQVYATVAKPGSADEAIEYFIDDLDMRMPLAEFFSSASVKTLPDRVLTADYIEQATIAGVPCDHLGLRGERVDLQVWVAQGDQPLPHRVIITYTRAEGQPQFRAQFSEWNLSPNAPDSLFTFTPPEGATKIAFAPRRQSEPEPPES